MATTTNEVELENFAPTQELSHPEVPDVVEIRREGSSEADGQTLEPIDGGWAAWRLLLAAFVFEALLWGRNMKTHASFGFLLRLQIHH